MAEAREQLRKMLRIQQLVLEIQNARTIVESGPGRIEEIEGSMMRTTGVPRYHLNSLIAPRTL